jgi:hypothetical protein
MFSDDSELRHGTPPVVWFRLHPTLAFANHPLTFAPYVPFGVGWNRWGRAFGARARCVF